MVFLYLLTGQLKKKSIGAPKAEINFKIYKNATECCILRKWISQLRTVQDILGIFNFVGAGLFVLPRCHYGSIYFY